MTELLRKTGQRLRRSVSQESYGNGVWISKKDGYKLGAFGVVIFGGSWVWHDWLGWPLPSEEVLDFFERALPVLAAAGGVLVARRLKP